MRGRKPCVRISGFGLVLASSITLLLFCAPSYAQRCAPPNCWIGTFYQYEVVAKTGQRNSLGIFSGFGRGPSINENGAVAFVGQVQNSSGQALGDVPFISEPGSNTVTAVAPNYLNAKRTFGNTLQINDGDQIATQDRFAGNPPSYYARVWDGNQHNFFTLVAQSSASGFQAILGNPAIDFSNDVAFSALNQSFHGVLVEGSSPYSQLNQVLFTTPLAPLIADNAYTVVRAGSTDTSPIVLYAPSLQTPTTIADTTDFTKLGQSPGISRDGAIVVFAGDLSSAGASGPKAWDKYAGPGIFVAVIQDGQIQYRARIAGFHYKNQDGMKLIQVDTKSVGKVPLEGSPWCDSPALTQLCQPFGELEDLPPFSKKTPVYFNTFTEAGFQGSTEWENRIGVLHSNLNGTAIDGSTIEVSFIATPNMSDSTGWALFTSNQGLWTVRADLFVKNAKLIAQVYRPIPVIQVGSTLAGPGGTVTGLGVYDDLANLSPEQANGDHQLGFWVSTSAGTNAQMLLRTTYIRQYGTSGYNETKCSPPLCQTATLGALALVSGGNYSLSNDHVLGRPVSKSQNGAVTTDQIVEPGPLDFLCENSRSVGNFFEAPPLDSGVDAALASLNPAEINATGQIYNIGIPSTISTAYVGEHVAKQGRSSGLTCGTVQSTTLKVSIPYESCTSGKAFSVPFVNQLLITSVDSSYPFSLAGDSGSLIVDANTAGPVGLQFAGTTSDSQSWANPIGAVMEALTAVAGQTVNLASSKAHVIAGCHFTQPEIILEHEETERAEVIMQNYETQILEDPATIGIGVGADETDPTKPSIIVIVERGRYHRLIPNSLDGVPVKLIVSERPRPLRSGGCDAKMQTTREKRRNSTR